MSNRQYFTSLFRLLLLVSVSLFCGSWQAILGQDWVGKIGGVSRIKHSPDPKTNLSYPAGKRPEARTKRTTVDSSAQPPTAARPDNKQAIELVIKQGNQSRKAQDYTQALSYYQKAQTLSPQDARAFYGMGNLYSDLLCNDSAINAYLKALDIKKDYLDALIGLGYVYAEEERYDHAQEQFQKALNQAGNNVEARIGLGLVYAKTGKYQEAMAQIKRIFTAESAEDQATGHIALGNVYEEQDDWQESITQFEKAISLKPDLAEAYLHLGMAQASLASSNTDFSSLKDAKTQDVAKMSTLLKQATGNIRRAIELKFNHPIAHAQLSQSLALQSNYQEAANEIKVYFSKIKELERQLSSLASMCGSGFTQLTALGHIALSNVHALEGNFETDQKKKTEFFNKAVEQANQAIQLKQDLAPAYEILGSIALAQKNYEEAIKQFKKAILFKINISDKAEIFTLMGLTYSQMGSEYDALALDHMEEAIKLNPNELDLYKLLASMYENRNQYELAIVLLKKVSESKPESADIYNKLGDAYYMWKGHPDEALANYQKAANYDPKNPKIYFDIAHIYAYQKHDADAAIAALKKAIEIKLDYAEAYLDLGRRYSQKDDYDEAIRWLKQAVKFKSDYAEAYTQLGRMYSYKEDYDEAIRWLKKAIEVKPDNAEAYNHLGWVYRYYMGGARADEGLSFLQKAAEYDPKDAYPYMQMAYIYSDLKKDDDATIKALKKAIELQPEYADAYSLLGRIYHLGKKNDAEAVKYLLQAIEFDPESPYAYFDVVDIYQDQKNYSEAIKYAKRALKVAPTIPRSYRELAEVYEDQKANEEAARYYEEGASHLDADDSFSKNLYLGRAARSRGDYAKAISYFQKLVPSNPPGKASYEIGMIYVVSKNKTAALEQHQELVRLKSPLAEELLKKIREMK